MPNRQNKPNNKRLVLTLAAFVGVMLGLAYASVPLYSLFCRATGFGGTPQRVEAHNQTTPVPERWVTVSFDGNVDSALPWDFAPDVKSVRVKLGDVTTIRYHAHNRGKGPVVGTATYNVQPDKAGEYFDKIQCFCFTQQVLKGGESLELPVEFYVDPAMATDKNSDDVKDITLSYTFFRAKDQGKANGIKQANLPSSESISNP